MMILTPVQIHCKFSVTHCLERFQTFANAVQPLLSVEFNFVLKSWSLDWLFNLWTIENSFFHLGLNYFGKLLP